MSRTPTESRTEISRQTPTHGMVPTMRELLRHRDFRLLMIGQTLSMFGDTAMLLTLGMWAKDLSGSNAVAGSVFVALGLPTLLAPLGGLIIDRFRRRQVMIAVDLVTAVLVASPTSMDMTM